MCLVIDSIVAYVAAIPISIWFSFCILTNVATVVTFGVTFWFEERKIYVEHHPNSNALSQMHNKTVRIIDITAGSIVLPFFLVILFYVHNNFVHNLESRIWDVSSKFCAICLPGVVNAVIMRDQYYQAVAAAYAVALLSQLKYHSLMLPDSKDQILAVAVVITTQLLGGVFGSVTAKRYIQAYLLAVPAAVGIIALFPNIVDFWKDVFGAIKAYNQAHFQPAAAHVEPPIGMA